MTKEGVIKINSTPCVLSGAASDAVNEDGEAVKMSSVTRADYMSIKELGDALEEETAE